MKLSLIFLCAAMLVTINVSSQDGPGIFKKNCAVCHTIGNGKLVGPDLKGVDKKHDLKWLTNWVKSSQALVKKNDPKAVQIFNDNNKMVMPDQALTDDEIKTVISFVGEQTTKLEQPAVVTAAPSAPVAVEMPGSVQSNSSTNFSSTSVIYILIAINVILTAIIIGLSKVIKEIANYNNKE